MKTLYCGKCRRLLKCLHFYKNRSRETGYARYCKECESAYKRIKYIEKKMDLS